MRSKLVLTVKGTSLPDIFPTPSTPSALGDIDVSLDHWSQSRIVPSDAPGYICIETETRAYATLEYAETLRDTQGADYSYSDQYTEKRIVRDRSTIRTYFKVDPLSVCVNYGQGVTNPVGTNKASVTKVAACVASWLAPFPHRVDAVGGNGGARA